MEKNRKVVVLHNYLGINEFWAYRLLKYIPEDIENIVLARYYFKTNFYIDRFTYIEFPIKNIDFNYSDFKVKLFNYTVFVITRLFLYRYVRFFLNSFQKKIDLVHSHFGNIGWYDIKLVNSLKVPHIVSFYGVDYIKYPKNCELLSNKLESFLLHSWMSRRLSIAGHSADRASSTGFSSGSSYPTVFWWEFSFSLPTFYCRKLFSLVIASVFNIQENFKNINCLYLSFKEERIRQLFYPKKWLRRYRELFRRADLFICEGNNGKKILVNYGCPEDKIVINRLGVDVKNIPFFKREKKKKSA